LFCPSLRLVIEVDGSTHLSKTDADQQRQRLLQSQGLHFLRISDADVKQDIDTVVRRISCEIDHLELALKQGALDNPRPPFTKGD
jgi:very-short-patch-repair endonuclease